MGTRGLLVAVSLALCLTGIGMAARGIAVPVKASMAQPGLERVYEQRLAARAALPEDERADGPAMVRTTTTQPEKARRVAALPSGGPVARIAVDRLGVKEIVLSGGATPEQFSRGPVMLRRGDAASPVTILAAHRDTHFLFIRDLREGDEVTLQLVTGEMERYRVARFETVRWDRFAYPLDPARPLLALATCYPFDGTEYGGPLRRVAWADRIS